MKRIFCLFLSSGIALSAIAQQVARNVSVDTPKPKKSFTADSLLGRWVIDINALGGAMTQDITTAKTDGNYKNGVNVAIGDVKLTNGTSYGFDGQLGFFFGHKRNFGIGAGFMYLFQNGDLTLNNYHVEYQATDKNGDTYRQLVTANGPIKEHLETSNLNIPLVLKYKKRFGKVLGFTADAGALFNVKIHNEYSTNASFDYEAIYKYQTNADGTTTVYESSPTPSVNDVLYTKAAFVPNPNYSLQQYFNSILPSRGYNVGLGVQPNSKNGSISYTTGSVGLIVRPALNFYLSDNVALNLGAYYMYQPFENTVQSGYMLTNKAGDYTSVMRTVSSANTQSYGGNIGVRILFGKQKDTDHDGIPDKKDKCPYVFGLARFDGCPDRDGDGIPDYADSCVDVPGLAKFNGCPDSDNDGIPDKEDECPYAPGPVAFHGCPDRDGDGTPDKDDLCPDKPGPKIYQGCPDSDGDGIPDNEDKCPDVAGPADNHGCPYPPKATVAPVEDKVKVSTPIMFELNKTVIHKSSYPVLEAAVAKMKEDKDAVIIVDGYTDITGKASYNRKLSVKRANAVKKHLISMGVNPRRIKIKGHGSSSPVGDNTTVEGRMENRRAVMHLNIAE